MLNTTMINMLVQKVSDQEIKEALFAMNSTSCGGPDGFNVVFFNASWHIVSHVFLAAVHNFFNKFRLLGEINATSSLFLKSGISKMLPLFVLFHAVMLFISVFPRF
jgi:hypothetical protein